MNDCRKAHIWNNDECLHCKIQELQQELVKIQGVALYWEGQVSYWENQYWNNRPTASERALKRLDGIKAEDSPIMKQLEEKFKNIK